MQLEEQRNTWANWRKKNSTD